MSQVAEGPFHGPRGSEARRIKKTRRLTIHRGFMARSFAGKDLI
jgi:hypothetical protein